MQARDGKLSMTQLKKQNDAQLQAIISQLLLLEAQLRREQKEILGQLTQRDMTIVAQRQEIDRLRRKNRRLINRLKKFTTENRGKEFEHDPLEPRNKVSRLDDMEVHDKASRIQHLEAFCNANRRDFSKSSCSTMPFVNTSEKTENTINHGNTNKSQMIRVATSVSELINIEDDSKAFQSAAGLTYKQKSKSLEAVNPNVASVRATTDRIMHKPPIAEKPKLINNKYCKVSSTLVKPPGITKVDGRQCNIVSTIHRLLEEESDGTAGGSGSSEPSSPEATLKPTTPRVIKLARKFEKTATNCKEMLGSKTSNCDSSPEFMRHDDRNLKSIIMDEHEVS